MTEIEFLHIADIPDPPDGYTLASSGVSNDGTGLFFFVDSSKAESVFATREEADFATFPETRTTGDVDAQLIEIAPDGAALTRLSGIDITFPFVDRLPNGNLLIVGSRAAYYPDGTYDSNALIFGSDGKLIRRVLLGDGIQSVFCDGRGRIWVAYFDEGVYGNFGWGSEDGPEPIGAAGLACFDDRGDVLWRFNSENEAHWIDDCYALNVRNELITVFYYSDFSICQIDGEFRRRFWDTDLGGCHAIAVHANQALLTGQYHDSPETGYLGTMSDDRLGDVQQVKFNIPRLGPDERVRFIGRGTTLNVFHGNRWLQHDMALLPA